MAAGQVTYNFHQIRFPNTVLNVKFWLYTLRQFGKGVQTGSYACYNISFKWIELCAGRAELKSTTMFLPC
jgi:hypothetical protein